MARVRSPNYPAFGLGEAIEKTKALYERQHRTSEPRDVVFKHMGYSGENGRSLKAISALTKYGLLDEQKDGNYRISELAINILFPESGEAKDAALKEAALSPALWREIYERWQNVKPTPESLEAYLVRRGFNMNAIEPIARSYAEIFDLVSTRVDAVTSQDPLQDIESLNDDSNFTHDEPTEAAQKTEQTPPSGPVRSGVASQKSNIPYTISLSGGVVGGTMALRTQQQVEELVKALTALKVMLPTIDLEEAK